jgi:hypothetical protein
MDRLRLWGKGKKMWEVLDEGNMSYIERMSGRMSRMRVLEFKIRVLREYLAGEGGGGGGEWREGGGR